MPRRITEGDSMAKPYFKPWPNDPERGDWYARVKVGDKWHSVSLRLTHGTKKQQLNKREAQTRSAALQTEIEMGELTPRTTQWLGGRATETIRRKLRLGELTPGADTPADWRSAHAGYLKAHEEKDRVPEMKGKLSLPAQTGPARQYVTGKFIDWVIESKETFPPRRPIHQIVCDWVDWRKTRISQLTGKPISPITVESELIYIVTLINWIARRGVVAPITKALREEIREHQPNLTGQGVIVPTWEEDVAITKKLHDNRLNWGPYPYRERGNWAMWLVYLLVRGLGCRTYEAISLTWDTVDLKRDVVRFMLPKELAKHKNRRRPAAPWRDVPILLQWCRDGLIEARERWEVVRDKRAKQGKPMTDAVCFNLQGGHWSKPHNMHKQRRITFARLGLPDGFRFGMARKCFIDQAYWMGYPFEAIASFTGHGEDVQRDYYCRQDMFLGDDEERDYGSFGDLTESGKRRLLLNVGRVARLLQYQATPVASLGETVSQYQEPVTKQASNGVAGGHPLSHTVMPEIPSEKQLESRSQKGKGDGQ
jgi:integrase